MKAHKILIAEDDPQLRRSLGIRLRAAGYDVVEAGDGYQAVALARSQSPELLLLDVNMPAGDGFSVQERVWNIAHMRRTPVIYITGDSGQGLENEAHRLGAIAVLHKPFETEDLLTTVACALAEGTPLETVPE